MSTEVLCITDETQVDKFLAKRSVLELLQCQSDDVVAVDMDCDEKQVRESYLRQKILPTTASDITSDLQDSELSFSSPKISPNMPIDTQAGGKYNDQKFSDGNSSNGQALSSTDKVAQTRVEAIEQSNNILWDRYAIGIERVAESWADKEITEDSWKLRYQLEIGEVEELHTMVRRAERQHMIAEKKNELLMSELRKQIKVNAELNVTLQSFSQTAIKE